ncbi:hypothetical protein [Natronoglycomyces albus]|uniref:hypothetical protein n=1 Tax=Natronoglycomyces albus TaxID=2811108 RepID=UPI001FEABEFE|nr:hypothetical protein [Natronoglycomyces albus]
MSLKPYTATTRSLLAGGSALIMGAATVAISSPAIAQDTTASPASSETAVIDCEVRQLPVPAGYEWTVTVSVDPTGTYIGGRAYPAEATAPVSAIMWHDDGITVIDTPGEEPWLNSINAHGDAVGTVTKDGQAVPIAYVDGEVISMKLYGEGYAMDINDAGEVVGYRHDGSGAVPIYWEYPEAEPQVLALPEGHSFGMGRGIDEDGTIVGHVFPHAGGGDVAYLWKSANDDGDILDIDHVEGTMDSFAFDISNGWIVGSAHIFGDDGTLEHQGLRWRSETGEYEILAHSNVSHINANGWTVGNTPTHAILQTDDGVFDLPGLAQPDEIGSTVTGISGRSVVGFALTSTEADGLTHGVEWRCE